MKWNLKFWDVRDVKLKSKIKINICVVNNNNNNGKLFKGKLVIVNKYIYMLE